uniref:Programmed cell death 5 n=1 Tax=Ovis aries TaxID=9940 RepID=A0AC11BZL8_SHEEP
MDLAYLTTVPAECCLEYRWFDPKGRQISSEGSSLCQVLRDPGDAAQQEAKHREAEMRNSILAQVLDQSARARLSNLALVKPEKTKAVENYLIQMARYGQLSGKVSEQGLIEILEKVSQQTEKKTTVKFNRRKVMDSDEDDDY